MDCAGVCDWVSAGGAVVASSSACLSNPDASLPTVTSLSHHCLPSAIGKRSGHHHSGDWESELRCFTCQAGTTLAWPVCLLPNRDEMPGSCRTQATYSVREQSRGTGRTLRPSLTPLIWLRQSQLQSEASLNLQCLLGSQTHPLQLLMPRSPLLGPDPSVSCMPHI